MRTLYFFGVTTRLTLGRAGRGYRPRQGKRRKTDRRRSRRPGLAREADLWLRVRPGPMML